MMQSTEEFSPLAAARRLLRVSPSGALATLDADSGAPFASLVSIATDPDGSPLLLLSDLALHTRNLKADARVGLLLARHGAGDPLQGERLSLNGTIRHTDSPAARRRFLARHPEAAGYAGFKDFGFYRLAVEHAHLVAGFGRIHALAGTDLLLDVSGATPLVEAEVEIVAHMNADHADAVALYATKLLAGAEGRWVMTGCDPEGLDLRKDDSCLRVVLDIPACDPAQMRARLAALAAAARKA